MLCLQQVSGMDRFLSTSFTSKAIPGEKTSSSRYTNLWRRCETFSSFNLQLRRSMPSSILPSSLILSWGRHASPCMLKKRRDCLPSNIVDLRRKTFFWNGNSTQIAAEKGNLAAFEPEGESLIQLVAARGDPFIIKEKGNNLPKERPNLLMSQLARLESSSLESRLILYNEWFEETFGSSFKMPCVD